MDHAPRRPRRTNGKTVHFNVDVRVRIVKPLHHRAKRSDLWVSREDLKRKRDEFHGILDCLTLDSSVYEEGGYFLVGLDSKKDQQMKYRNVLDARYAVLKAQRLQDINSRWHCGVGSANNQDCISQSYQEHTTEASNAAQYTATRLEEELNAEEKPEAEIMSLGAVQTLLQRTSSHRSTSHRAGSFSMSSRSESFNECKDIYRRASSISNSSRSGSFNEFMDIWIQEVQEVQEVHSADSSGDDWSADLSSDDDEDFFGESVEIPIREHDRKSNLNRYALPEAGEEIRSTAASSDWSGDISTDNDDDFLAEARVVESPHILSSHVVKRGSPQGSEIYVPNIIQAIPEHPPVPNNAIAA
ncbi:MAG: hypothetical protein SGBAC_010953 [Bacillariaceae sp.]